MLINKTSKNFYFFLSILIITASAYTQPTKKDYAITATELCIFLYTQYGLQTDPPDQNVLNKPNQFDHYMRNSLYWKNNQQIAKNLSDILLYGLFVGSIPITPMLSKNHYLDYLLNNLEILSVNGIVTNFFKHTVKRKRPYLHYKTNPENEDSFRSFFSGHTSSSFAIGTATALTLMKNTDYNKKYILASMYSIAALNGYLRIAADKHYTTDVITGAVIGSAIGFYISKKNFLKLKDDQASIALNRNQIRINWKL